MLKKILIAGVGLLLVSMTGRAALIAGWDFESGTPYIANSGNQSGTATLTPTGTQIIGTEGANEFLSFNTTAGGSFILHVSRNGFTDFSVTYDARKGGDSPTVTW